MVYVVKLLGNDNVWIHVVCATDWLNDIEVVRQAEIQRQEDEKLKVEKLRLQNEANKKHSANIHNAMMQAIVSAGFDAGIAKAVVIMLKENKIPHIGKIQY